MEVKVLIGNIEKLKTTVALQEEKDKDGEVVNRRLVTKVQFECEVEPENLATIHRLLASETPVFVYMGSRQSLMDMVRSGQRPRHSAKPFIFRCRALRTLAHMKKCPPLSESPLRN